MIWTFLFIVAFLLIVGPGLRGILRRLIRIYGIYFVIAFVVRSVLLVLLQPAPQENSSFAISVLAYRGYVESLDAVLPYACAASFAVYLSAFIGQRLFIPKQDMLTFAVQPSGAAVIYLFGLLLRMGDILAYDSVFSSRLASLGQGVSLGILAALILATDWRKRAAVLTLTLCAVEAFTSIPLASKTPLLTVLLLLYLDPRRPRLHVRMVLMSCLGVVFAFTSLQSLKSTANPLQGQNWVEQTFFSLTGRLDGLYALSGAWISGPGSYRPEGGVLQAALGGLLPGWLQYDDKILAGRLWGINVYGVDTGVSYAEGLSAEGYVLMGMWGPVLWGLLGGLVFIAVTQAIRSKSRYIQIAGFSMLASTVLFERGLLGQMEQVGSALQSSAIACVALVVFEGLNRRGGRNDHRRGVLSIGKRDP